jgi:hypothetical protein
MYLCTSYLPTYGGRRPSSKTRVRELTVPKSEWGSCELTLSRQERSRKGILCYLSHTPCVRVEAYIGGTTCPDLFTIRCVLVQQAPHQASGRNNVRHANRVGPGSSLLFHRAVSNVNGRWTPSRSKGQTTVSLKCIPWYGYVRFAHFHA